MTVLAPPHMHSVSVARPRGMFVGAYRGLVNLLRLGLIDDETVGEGAMLDGIIPRHVLRRLLSALQFRDPGTMRHGRRVAILAVALAEHLGWDGRSLKVLEVASLLHDIGKIGVPDTVLYKPAKLSEDELELMSLHYGIVLDVLQACRVDQEVLQIVSQSQVVSAGTDGLKRLNFAPHLGARILAVADAYESLSGSRAYRSARQHEEIMEILNEGVGQQFDGNVVTALSRYVSLRGLPFDQHAEELDETLRRHGPESIDDLHDVNELCHIFSNLYILESLYDGFFILDADYRVRCWNRGVEHLLGYPLLEMYGKPWSSRKMSSSDDNTTPGQSQESAPLMEQALQAGRPVVAQMTMTRTDGRKLDVEAHAVPLFDDEGHMLGVLQIMRDLTRSGRRRTGELAELKLAASRDALTSLANRGELEAQLSQMVIDFSRDHQRPFSVIFSDADHFKSINDTHGHGVGDQVLVDLARLLEQETYSGELVGRYGGEEFVILCPDTNIEEAVRRAERIRHAIELTQVGGVKSLRVTASFGVAQAEPGDTAEKVLRRADQALYKAKHTGRNRTCSLTGAELKNQTGPETETPETPETGSEFEYETSFVANVPEDIIVYKLSGFVNDHDAQLVEVSTSRVLLRAGRTGLFGFWGSQPKHQPVEIEICFDDRALEGKSGRKVAAKANFQVKVRPQGWLLKSDVFKLRAFRITTELKHYFAGV